MSPEQLSGKRSRWDGRTDQYSLAVVAYELLAGHLPFEGDDDMSLMLAINQDVPDPIPHQPDSVCGVLLKALAKQREQRFPTCSDFVTALNAPQSEAESAPSNCPSMGAHAALHNTVVKIPREVLLGIIHRHLRTTKVTSIFPDIPTDIRSNVGNYYRDWIAPSDAILFVYDSTVFGSGKDGFIITDSGVGVKAPSFSPTFRKFRDIEKVDTYFGKTQGFWDFSDKHIDQLQIGDMAVALTHNKLAYPSGELGTGLANVLCEINGVLRGTLGNDDAPHVANVL